MKFFGNSKTTRLIEEYYQFVLPLASASLIAAVWLPKFIGYGEEFSNKFTDLSYESTMRRGYLDKVPHYRKGWDDALFVFYIFNIVTVFRYIYTNFIMKPIARKLSMGKGLTRKFVDVGWFSFYYLAATVWGIIIFRDDDWWYSTRHFWDGYPHPFDYASKYFYLASLAFWIQCLFSFFFEAPRKDDKAFFFHHLLTIGLIVGSYHFNYFRIGAAILMEQNAADVLYYHAKMFKYAGLEKTATSTLVVFLFVWVYTRHFIFGFILYSVWFELPNHISAAGWDPVSGYYFSDSLW